MRDVLMIGWMAIAIACGAGCRKEPDKPAPPADSGEPRAAATAGVRADLQPRDRPGDAGAHATGGVFNDTPASLPSTRPQR